MDQSPLGPNVRRPRGLRVAGWIGLALIVVAASGCAHKRKSMRPVYLSPAPVSADCPSGVGCPPSSTVVPAGEPSMTPSAAPPGATISTPTIEPGLEPASLPAEAPLGSTTGPNIPRIDSPPPVTAPSTTPNAADEPGLEPISPSGTSSTRSSARPTPGAGVPRATPGPAPAASLKDSQLGTTSRRRVAPAPTQGRVRQASASALRDEVRPFVNDADDLFAPPKADRPWKYIVMHHSASKAGGYASIDQEHRKRLGWNGCGYHFVIGNGTETPDGTIEVSQRWVNQKLGVHCRDGKHPDVNEYGIGVCLVGDLENTPPTPKQIAAARALVAYLSDRYQIPADHIEAHSSLAVSPTSCPGRHFPRQAILNPSGLAFHLDD